MEKRKLRVLMTVVIIVNLVAIAFVLYQPKENRKRAENGLLTETGALQFVTLAVEAWKDERSEIKSVEVNFKAGYEAELKTVNGQSLWQFIVSVTACTQKGNVKTESFNIRIDAYTGESLGVAAPLINWDGNEQLTEAEALKLAEQFILDYEKENKNIVSLIVHTQEGGYTAKQKTVRAKQVWDIEVMVTAFPIKSYQGGTPITELYVLYVDVDSGEITHFGKSLNAVWYNGK